MAVDRAIERRGDTLYLRRTRPLALREVIGSREYIRSLQTNDLAEARTIRNALEPALDLGWKHAVRIIVEGKGDAQERHELEQLGPLGIVAHFEQQADDFLRDELLAREERVAEAVQLTMPGELHPTERRVRGAYAAGVGKGGGAVAGELATLASRMSELLSGNGVFNKGLTELLESLLERQAEKHAVEERARAEELKASFAEQFKSMTTGSAPMKESPKLIDAVNEHLEEHKNAWARQVYSTRVTSLRAMAEAIGADKPVRTITVADVDRWRAATMGGFKKATADRKLAELSALFEWCRLRGYADVNVARDAKKLAQRARSGEEKRDSQERGAFTADEVARLFDPSFAELSPMDRRNPESVITRLLGPVMMLFGGFRPNELGWMRPQDIVAVNGVWCARVQSYNTKEHPKGRYTVKTFEARTVPLHSTIVGVVRKLAELRKGEAFLLPGISTTGNGGRINAIVGRFGRRIAELGLKGGEERGALVPYSLRHTFAQHMKAAGVSTEIREDIMGHKTPGQAARYAKSDHVALMAAAVEKFDPTPVRELVEWIAGEVKA